VIGQTDPPADAAALAALARQVDRLQTAVDADLPGLRRDVDTLDDLRGAVALGVGSATQAVLAASGLA
jgi:2-phospho-L-lactate guanylyltransferase (CobY/MobA/RfbA family)